MVDSAVDWNNFAVHVSYYVKVKLLLSGVGGGVSVRVPFISVREAHVDSAPTAPEAPTQDKVAAEDKDGERQAHVAADVHAPRTEAAVAAGPEGQNNNLEPDDSGKLPVRPEDVCRSSDV